MRTVTIPRSRVFHGPLAVVNRSHPLRGDIPTDLAGQEIRPVSGWRSREEQQSIWDMALAEEGAAFTRKYVALPGCSEHQSGLAIDLGRACEPVDPICPDFPYDGVFGAFRRAAADYGFIERYQSGKEHLTGIAAEPWHFRYVGVPHAWAFYIPCAQAEVDIPLPDTCCQLSGDNIGGLIVAAWEKPL